MTDLREDEPTIRRRRAPSWRWILLAVAVVVAAPVAVYVIVLRDPAEPVSVGDVVERFREGSDGGDGGAAAGTAGSTEPVGGPPRPGVYLYATTGSEEVDALGGSGHEYPGQTTVTVTATGDDCLLARWDALSQRWDSEVLCPTDAGGWSRPRSTLFHSFYNQDETREYTCDAGGYVPPPDGDGTFTWTCVSEGSGRSGESRVQAEGEVVGVESVTVAGAERRGLHVRYVTTIGGETTGTGTIDRWYALDRFPLVLRETRSETTESHTAIGTVHHREDYELTLTTWEPQR